MAAAYTYAVAIALNLRTYVWGEIKKLDQKMKICFLTAGEMYYGAYSDIFSSLPANCFIRKPITNEELLEHLNELLYGDSRENLPE